MFIILKLVLIILLNETNAYMIQETETILLPASIPTGAKKISLTLKVFGQLITLNLCRNDGIVSPAFRDIWKYNRKNDTEKLLEINVSNPCYYDHEDYICSAIVNFCHEYGLEGFIFLENDTIEIRPFWNEFSPMCLIDDFREQTDLSFGKPYVIKKSLQYFADLNLYHWDMFKVKQRYVRNAQQNLTIELAVFLDKVAYYNSMFVVEYNEVKLHNMILAYVNRIQDVFNRSNLDVFIRIMLIHLNILYKQPSHLPVSDDDADQVLDLFCKYAKSLNFPNDNDPRHWDIALYLTGVNLYEKYTKHITSLFAQYTTEKNYTTTGKTYHDGACDPLLSCAIVEFRDLYEMASSVDAVYKIGSLLRLTQKRNSNNSKMYVTWSEDSRDIARKLWKTKHCLLDHTTRENPYPYSLDHLSYLDLPGREWTAKAQCEIFLSDKDANVVTLHDICQVLQCETPHKNKYFYAGPALNGTPCALGKECRGGECVPLIEPPYIFNYCEETEANWSEWKEDSCKSNCLTKSKGVVIKRRSCVERTKHQTYKTSSCDGLYYKVDLCDDSSLCTEERKSIDKHADIKCSDFNSKIKSRKEYFNAMVDEPGWQAPHDDEKPWIACTVICLREEKTSATHSIYHDIAPRLEMIDLGIDPYFADGTWCHEKDGQNYYCRQHYCLPENYSFEK